MKKKRYTDLEIIEAVKTSFSIAEVCRKVGLKPVGGNYKTIHNKIDKLQLDISHFTGQGWNVGPRYKPVKVAKSLSEYLIQGSQYQSYKLIRRLFKEGYKEKICEKCNNTKWMNETIPLELHHINGISNDNRLENLQVLCPNCHALTDNYRGKNIGVSAQGEILDVEQP